MEALKQLRKHAADKRDKAIKRAQAEYELAMTRIAELDQMLFGFVPVGRLTIAESIEKVLPTDRPFTTADIMAGLVALDPDRRWRPRSIDNHVTVMRKRGMIRRLRKSGIRRRALYVVSGLDIPQIPFEDMRVVDALKLVLGQAERPLTVTELCVRVLDMGLQTEMNDRHFMNYVTVQLTNDSEFAVTDQGKWRVG